jgi:DNA end-binding protein Ku
VRSLWNGTLHLAKLPPIPVGLVAGKGRSDVSLTTLHRPCSNRLEQSIQCPVHGEVSDDELVKAWQVTPGEYVLIEDDELQAAEQTSDEHRIDVAAIVAAAAIDPTMVTNTYFVKPSGKSAAALQLYALLAAALDDNEAAGALP